MTKKTFDFSEALRRMRKGKWVSRDGSEEALTIIKGKLISADVSCLDTKFDICGVSDDYILATDWEEVNQ